MKESLHTTRRIGKELIQKKKQAVLESAGADAEKGGHVGRDLLSVCGGSRWGCGYYHGH